MARLTQAFGWSSTSGWWVNGAVSTPVLIGRFEVRDGFGDTIHVRPLTQTSAGMLSFGLSEAQLGHSRAVADPALAESPNVMRALHHIIGEDREFFVSENQALN